MSADDNDDSAATRYQGYTDLRGVSDRIARTVEEAITAIARIDSAHNEGARLSPDTVAQQRAAIIDAMLTLSVELQNDAEDVPEYDEMLTDWFGDGDEPGYLERLTQLQLTETRPGFLMQLGMDLRRAGWELGYLRAGQQSLNEADMSEKERIREKLLE